MRLRFLLTAGAAALALPAAALGGAPTNGGSSGGAFVSPCSGNLLDYSIDFTRQGGGNAFVFTGFGTATESATGATFDVRYRSIIVGDPFVDTRWSSNSTMVIHGDAYTLTIHDTTMTNGHPDPPHILPNRGNWTCSGAGVVN